MNREIEFRIWADNQFYYKCLVGNTNDTTDNNWTCPMVWLEDKKEWVNCDNGIIQQYTGLKDKNGKKIFEGDIVIAHDMKFVVKFGEYRTKIFDETFKSATRTKQFGWYCESIENKEHCNLVTPNGIEVISNIYENNLESFED